MDSVPTKHTHIFENTSQMYKFDFLQNGISNHLKQLAAPVFSKRHLNRSG